MGCCDPKDEVNEVPLTERANLKASSQRKCTDCCCLLIFALCVGVMIIIQCAAAAVGDPLKLTHGADYTGQMCGVGPMADKPYTHYPRLGKDLVAQRGKFATSPWSISLYGLCVEECPARDEDLMDYPCEAGHPGCMWTTNPLATSVIRLQFDERNSWHTAVGTSSLMGRCMPIAITRTSDTELCAFPDCHTAHKECYREAFPDEGYWLPDTTEERFNCERLVKLSTSRVSTSPESDIEAEFIGAFFGGIAGTTEQLSLAAVELFVFGVIVAMFANFFLLRVLRTCMAVIFVLSMVVLLLLLLFANVFLFAKAGIIDVDRTTSTALGALHDVASHFNMTHFTSAVETASGSISGAVSSNAELFAVVAEGELENYKLGAYACLGVTALVVGVLVIISGKLKNALAICAMATKPIAAMPSLLLLPFLSVVLTTVVIVNFFGTVVMFLTPDPQEMTDWLLYFTGNLTNAVLDAAGQTVEDLAVDSDNAELEGLATQLETLDVQLQELPVDAIKLVYSLAGFEVFSCLWILFLIEAVAYTTISGAVSYWYFTGSQLDNDLVDPRDRTRFPITASLYRCLRFHLGSLAFGSFVLALFTALRALLAYLDEKTKTLQESNLLVKLVLCCARCCLWVFDRFLKFLTKFAFVTIAADGASYCRATAAAWRLTTEHPVQMLANEAAMAVLSLLQLLVTPICCSILAYNAVQGQWRTYVFQGFDAVDGWGQSLCEQYESDAVDACGYKSSFLNFLSFLAFQDWLPADKPDAFKVAVATLLLSFWVTRIFRDVYAAAVDTIFVCCVRVEDQPVCRFYKKDDIQETVMHGSSKSLVT